jgi:hypothetical protein
MVLPKYILEEINFGKIFSRAMELSYLRRQKWWNFIFRFFGSDLYVSQSDLDNASEELYPGDRYAKTDMTAYQLFLCGSIINADCIV